MLAEASEFGKNGITGMLMGSILSQPFTPARARQRRLHAALGGTAAGDGRQEPAAGQNGSEFVKESERRQDPVANFRVNWVHGPSAVSADKQKRCTELTGARQFAVMKKPTSIAPQ